MKKIISVAIAFLAIIAMTGIVSAESVVELQMNLVSGTVFSDVAYKYTTYGGLPYGEATYQSNLNSINTDMSLSHSLLAEGSDIQSEACFSAGDVASEKLLVGPTIQTILYEESISRALITGECEGESNGESEGAVCFTGKSEFAFLVNKIDVASTSITEEVGTIEHAIDATGYGAFKVDAAIANIYGSTEGSYAQDAMDMSIYAVDSEFSFLSFFSGQP